MLTKYRIQFQQIQSGASYVWDHLIKVRLEDRIF